MGTRPAVEIRGLRKGYGGPPVLHHLDLTVDRGTVLAVLGPNGAGKTTTVRVLATLLAPDAGTVRVAGLDVVRDRAEVRRRIAVTGQSTAVDDVLTGAENLRFAARLRGLGRAAARARTAELLGLVGLAEHADRRAGTYSGGMRRRLDLALGLTTVPEVLLLDEPTTGLDPTSRRALWDVVRSLREAGTTGLLTTQYLEEADRLAEQVVVVDHGRVVAQGTPEELKERVVPRRLEVTFHDARTHADAVRRLGRGLLAADPTAFTVTLPAGDAASVRAVLDDLDPGRATVRDFAVRSASLDDVFHALTEGRAVPAGRQAVDA